jgi:hypothetical protein
MDGLDKFEKLTAESQFTLVLLANEESGDFELIDPQPVPEDRAKTFAERGLTFGGVLGVVSGKPRSALAMPLDGETVTRIVGEFTRRVEYALKHPRWVMPSACA